MKNIIIILFLFGAMKSNAQSYNETDSLYLIAFEKYSIQLDSFYTKYSENNEQYSMIFIERTDLIKNLPDSIGERKIVTLNNENLKEVYKKYDWKLIQLKVFPIEIKKGQIEITFIPYHGEMDKKGNLNLGLSDWTNIFFQYDCNQKKWIYERTENGGI
ncbi:hypothetical protein [Flammeovirga sp. SJP92]|uniref:hypothetical protein n=1 Tax=Flammeovirga sp. SJP92 TaxID=1775430 RepID=UPI000792B034|nr:hypothetical protein [Flammeovirga sp. SJP92]KXX69455.1 hypothetical protein AVL50_19075 [Flammeovirga sp. SJP92]